MTGFNLSAWAITHRPLVHYFMAMLVIIGVASYMKLGRNEDPTFTIKAMTVRTQWPGATLEETLLQITERIERKLQETPYLDYIKSYTNPGQSTIFVYLKGSSGPKAVVGRLVPGPQEDQRHRVDPAPGRHRPGLRRRIR